MLPGTTTERDGAVPNLVPPHLTGLILGGSSAASGRFGHAAARPAHDGAPQAPRQRAVGPGRRIPTASGKAAPGGDGSGSSGAASSSGSTGAGSGASVWLRGGAPLNISWRAAGMGAVAGIGGGIGGGIFAPPAKANLLRLWPFPGRRKKAGGKGGQKTVLIMMSNTGGGHKASAEALQQAFQEEYGDKYRVVIVDMWKQHTPAPFNSLCDSYSFLVRHGVLWRVTYGVMQPRMVHGPYFSAVQAFVARHLTEAFDHYAPDLVVSVHPLMQHIPVRILAARAAARGEAPPPFATVVTDFTTCHNTWFFPGVTRCFVPTEYCRNLAVAMGVAREKIVVHGLPIRPIFSKRLPSKASLRSKLGLKKDGPAVLLVGGGEGMGALEATVRELDARLAGGAQVAVICGRNRALLNKLRSTRWPGGCHVVAVGFVDNVHEWMAACDAIITKAGPGTIAEALISGLPILLNGNVPCQEEGNIPYVVENGVGAFETNPARITDIMAGWLDPARRGEFEAMARRSKALGRPRAVYNIAHDLAGLAEAAAPLVVDAAAKTKAIMAEGRPCCGGKKPALVAA